MTPPGSREQQRELVRRAIEKLPAPYRVVDSVRDIEGLSTEATATALDLTCQAVKTRLHRARLKLRGELAPHFEQPDPGDAP